VTPLAPQSFPQRQDVAIGRIRIPSIWCSERTRRRQWQEGPGSFRAIGRISVLRNSGCSRRNCRRTRNQYESATIRPHPQRWQVAPDRSSRKIRNTTFAPARIISGSKEPVTKAKTDTRSTKKQIHKVLCFLCSSCAFCVPVPDGPYNQRSNARSQDLSTRMSR
jgi:hypothetical protein